MGHQGELLQKLTDSTMRIPFSSMTLRILSKQNGIGPIFSNNIAPTGKCNACMWPSSDCLNYYKMA